jgi:hypothetical protein
VLVSSFRCGFDKDRRGSSDPGYGDGTGWLGLIFVAVFVVCGFLTCLSGLKVLRKSSLSEGKEKMDGPRSFAFKDETAFLTGLSLGGMLRTTDDVELAESNTCSDRTYEGFMTSSDSKTCGAASSSEAWCLLRLDLRLEALESGSMVTAAARFLLV